MESTTIAADLAKNVIEVAIAQGNGRITKRQRLSRDGFAQLLATHPRCRVVMEACGSAHHWARKGQEVGHEVRLLPAQYVRPYRRRNKTDRADCSALLQANGDGEILPVAVKSVAQQAVQGLHRLRSQWMGTRTARINGLRGLLREFGICLPMGAAKALQELPLAIDSEVVPPMLKDSLHSMRAEVRELEARITDVEKQLARMTRDDAAVQAVQQVSGIGLLTSTALVASAVDAKNFRSGRHLAAWLGLTPREHSSGEKRQLGKMSKRGDVYVRTLLIHGARSVLQRAQVLHCAGRELSRLQRWALDLQARAGHNKAAVGVANKLARVAWACWRHGTDFDGNHAVAA